MRVVRYTRTAIKALKAMPAKDRNTIMRKMDSFAAGDLHDITALKGSEFFRLRHGNWRAVFEMNEKEILVLDVAHRREIYR